MGSVLGVLEMGAAGVAAVTAVVAAFVVHVLRRDGVRLWRPDRPAALPGTRSYPQIPGRRSAAILAPSSRVVEGVVVPRRELGR